MQVARRGAQGSLILIGLMGLALGYEIRPASQNRPHQCEPPQVLGADGHCVFKEQCPDGSLPGIGGKCFSKDAQPVQPAVVSHTCKTTFAALPKDVPRAGCMGGRHGVPRKAFFANGKMIDVFEKYLRDAEQQGQPVDLRYLSLIFFDQQNQQRTILSPKLKLSHYFAGKSIKDLWRKALRDEIAQPRNQPSDDGEKVGADVVCGD